MRRCALPVVTRPAGVCWWLHRLRSTGGVAGGRGGRGGAVGDAKCRGRVSLLGGGRDADGGDSVESSGGGQIFRCRACGGPFVEEVSRDVHEVACTGQERMRGCRHTNARQGNGPPLALEERQRVADKWYRTEGRCSLVKVEGDGDCLFHALAVCGVRVTRRKLVRWLNDAKVAKKRAEAKRLLEGKWPTEVTVEEIAAQEGVRLHVDAWSEARRGYEQRPHTCSYGPRTGRVVRIANFYPVHFDAVRYKEGGHEEPAQEAPAVVPWPRARWEAEIGTPRGDNRVRKAAWGSPLLMGVSGCRADSDDDRRQAEGADAEVEEERLRQREAEEKRAGRCIGTTKDGKACKVRASDGRMTCKRHRKQEPMSVRIDDEGRIAELSGGSEELRAKEEDVAGREQKRDSEVKKRKKKRREAVEVCGKSVEALELVRELNQKFKLRTVLKLFAEREESGKPAGVRYTAVFEKGAPLYKVAKTGSDKWHPVEKEKWPAAVSRCMAERDGGKRAASVAMTRRRERIRGDELVDVRRMYGEFLRRRSRLEEKLKKSEKDEPKEAEKVSRESKRKSVRQCAEERRKSKRKRARQCAEQSTMTVLAWNVRGLSSTESLALARAEVVGADVIVLTETHEDATAVRMRGAFAEAGWEYRGSRRRNRQGGGVGIAVRKSGMASWKWSGGKEKRGCEVVTVETADVVIIAAYITPTKSDAGLVKLREQTLRSVSREIEEAKGRGRDVVLVGDLNLRPNVKQLEAVSSCEGSRNRAGSWRGDGVTKAELVQVKSWGLELRNGLWGQESAVQTLRGFDTTPDQVWLSPRLTVARSQTMLEKVEVEGDDEKSDHIPLVLTVRDAGGREAKADEEEQKSRADVGKSGEGKLVQKPVKWHEWGENEVREYNRRVREKLLESDRPECSGGNAAKCEEALRICAEGVENNRKSEQSSYKKSGEFWSDDLKKKQDELRKVKRRKWQDPRRRKAVREFQVEYARRLKQWRSARPKRWAEELKADSRAAWRRLKSAGLVEKAGFETGDSTGVKREDGTILQGQEAAGETGKYVKRLLVADWSLDELKFDRDRELLLAGLWGWKGVVDDRKHDDDEWVQAQLESGNPLPKLMQEGMTDGEWNGSVDRAKKQKAPGKDGTRNEHVKLLDGENRKKVFNAWNEVYESEVNPPDWRRRVVTFLDKASTVDRSVLAEKRGVSLLSAPAKIFRGALTQRVWPVVRAGLERTQALKYPEEGCVHNVLTLTQKIGERMEAGKSTYVMLADLRKAFDTANRRLVWVRLRQLGVAGKLFAALQRGYVKGVAAGRHRDKSGTTFSRDYDDAGLGVTQGGVDSSLLFAILADKLDAEIEQMERGQWLGVPLQTQERDNSDVERLVCLKHADDTALICGSASDLQDAVRGFEQWCRRWQIAPQPTKCKVLVFEAKKEKRARTQPRIDLVGKTLEVVKSSLYLGYMLDVETTWGKHVDRRLKKAAAWDGVAQQLTGGSGAATVEAAAVVRRATAEAGILYGAEMWGAAGSREAAEADMHQAKVAKEILGTRNAAEAEGVLTELGWMRVSTLAVQSRLELWRRLATTASRALQEIEWSAEKWLSATEEEKVEANRYNWWRSTLVEADAVAAEAGLTRGQLRALAGKDFSRVVKLTLWEREWQQRTKRMAESSRLQDYAWRLMTSRLSGELRPGKWPMAEYLKHVDSRYHARLLANCRLGLLAVEEETGRWRGLPREERVCPLCSTGMEDVRHLLEKCSVCEEKDKPRTGLWSLVVGQGRCGATWRKVAGAVEARWRLRKKLVAKSSCEIEDTEDTEGTVELECGDATSEGEGWEEGSGADDLYVNSLAEAEARDVRAEIYTDGSGDVTEDGSERAGWGCWMIAEMDAEGRRKVGEWCGPVVTDNRQNEFRGAERCTNNTGELSAIVAALDAVADLKPAGTTLIRFDSEYAAHMTTGLWKPKSNVQLVENARRALAATRHVAAVAFMHVKGHAGIRGNVEADRLASRGRLMPRAGEVVWKAATAAECGIEFGRPEVLRDGAGQHVRSAEQSARVRVSVGRKRNRAKKRT